MSDGDALGRAVAFERAMFERAASRTEPFEHGLAHFHERFPLMWNLNFLRVDDPGASATALIDEAERIQGAAGLAHRRVYVPDAAHGARLVPGFEVAGWKVETLVIMAKTPPFTPDDVPLVEEVDDGTYASFRRLQAETSPWRDEPETVEQMAERHVTYLDATTAINLAVYADGRIVSGAQLYSDGKSLQIEEIGTMEGSRGRGYASALVRYGEAYAARAGHDLYFLFADANDWPKELYRKLGFEPVGLSYDFVRSESS